VDRLRTFDTNESVVESTEEVTKVVRVEPHQAQNGRVKILHVIAVIHCHGTQFVSLTNRDTTLHSATGHPHGKAVAVVITPGALSIFRSRLAAKLASPNHESIFEHSATLQVLEKTGNWLVSSSGVVIVILLQITMSVPVIIIMGAS